MFFSKIAASATTVAGVMASFKKTIDDLNQVESFQSNKAERLAKEAKAAAIDSAFAQEEANAAREVAGKLSSLISAGGV